MRWLCGFIVSVLLLTVGATWAHAQSVTGQVLSAGLGGNVRMPHGYYRIGSWVPVKVRLENRGSETQEILLGIEQKDLDGDTVLSLSEKIILSPGLEAVDRWVYYWPQPDDDGRGIRSVQVLDADTESVITSIRVPPAPETRRPGLWPRAVDDGRELRLIALAGPSTVGMEHYFRSLGSNAVVHMLRLPTGDDLPHRAIGLDGVDVLILQADHLRIDTQTQAEFQQKAIREWVRAGGHLIITVGAQWQSLGQSTQLWDLLPMTPTGTTEREIGSLASYLPLTGGKVSQVVGTLRPGARALYQGRPTADAPLVVERVYGAGVVTMVTIDVAQPDINQAMAAEAWLGFWREVAGIRGDVITSAAMNGPPPLELKSSAGAVDLDRGVAGSIDFAAQTSLGVMLAVLFLGTYWVVAGPGGHLVLRRLRMTHWSWWVFGGTVVVASAAAVLIVSLFRLQQTDLRHRTIVLGQVGTTEASVLGFYGAYAPVDGRVAMALPETDGLSYLAPFNEAMDHEVQPFADPQSYHLTNAQPGVAVLPFRNTLKKMQGRWVGNWGGMLEGDDLRAYMGPAGSGRPRDVVLAGSLTNRTGYDLHHVRIVALSEGDSREPARIFDMHTVSVWRDGQKLELDTLRPSGAFTRRTYKLNSYDYAMDLQLMLDDVSRSLRADSALGAGFGHMTEVGQIEQARNEPRRQDMLTLLLDWRRPASLNPNVSDVRVEAGRQLTRVADRAAEFRASRFLITATAGSPDAPVRAPVPLRINDRELSGKGEVLFAWTAQVGGPPPASAPANR